MDSNSGGLGASKGADDDHSEEGRTSLETLRTDISVLPTRNILYC